MPRYKSFNRYRVHGRFSTMILVNKIEKLEISPLYIKTKKRNPAGARLLNLAKLPHVYVCATHTHPRKYDFLISTPTNSLLARRLRLHVHQIDVAQFVYGLPTVLSNLGVCGS